jgi:hypothetical protein
MDVVEAGIRTREDARVMLVEAQTCWRSRCARYLIDGVAEADSIATDLQANEQQRASLATQIEEVEAE